MSHSVPAFLRDWCMKAQMQNVLARTQVDWNLNRGAAVQPIMLSSGRGEASHASATGNCVAQAELKSATL